MPGCVLVLTVLLRMHREVTCVYLGQSGVPERISHQPVAMAEEKTHSYNFRNAAVESLNVVLRFFFLGEKLVVEICGRCIKIQDNLL